MRAACMGMMLLLGVAVMAAPAVAQPDVSRRTGSTVADAEVPGWQWRQLRVASADGQRHYRVRVAVPKTTPPAGGFPVAYLLDGNAALMEIDAALLVQLATAPHPPVIAFIAHEASAICSSCIIPIRSGIFVSQVFGRSSIRIRSAMVEYYL